MKELSWLLQGPPVEEAFDEEKLVRYREFLEAYATRLAGVGNAIWESWLPSTSARPREQKRRTDRSRSKKNRSGSNGSAI